MGLPYDIVRIQKYNPKWAEDYEKEREEISAILNNSSFEIRHIGSTSIPEMPAKPIIDIMVGVNTNEDFQECIESLEKVGYDYFGECGRPGRIFFVKGEPGNCTNHLHLVVKDSNYWVNNILLAEYFKKNEQAARKYAEKKIELAVQYREDRHMYRIFKSEYISKVLDEVSSDVAIDTYQLGKEWKNDVGDISFSRKCKCPNINAEM